MEKTKSKKNLKFDYKKIKTFENACEKEGINPELLPDVSMIPEEYRKSIIAHYKLQIIYKAINNGWNPNFEDSIQNKYYPWFYFNTVPASGGGFSCYDFAYTSATTHVGSRLCVESESKAKFIGTQFEIEYNDLFL